VCAGTFPRMTAQRYVNSNGTAGTMTTDKHMKM
jgi:hypothetical protein